MTRILGGTLAFLLLGALAPAGDDGVRPLHKHRWPSMYPRMHYWTPNVYRVHAWLQPIGPYIRPINTTPGLVPQYKVDSYRIPPVDPAARPYYPNLGSGPDIKEGTASSGR